MSLQAALELVRVAKRARDDATLTPASIAESMSARDARRARVRGSVGGVVRLSLREDPRVLERLKKLKRRSPFYTRFDADALYKELVLENVVAQGQEVKRIPHHFNWEVARDVEVFVGNKFVCKVVRGVQGLPPAPEQWDAFRPHMKRPSLRVSERGFVEHVGSLRKKVGGSVGRFAPKPRSGGVEFEDYVRWVDNFYNTLLTTSNALADVEQLIDATQGTSDAHFCQVHVDDDAKHAKTIMYAETSDDVVGGELVFPTLALVVALNHGDIVVWDARFFHCTAEQRQLDDSIDGKMQAAVAQRSHPTRRPIHTRAGTRPLNENARALRHCIWMNSRLGKSLGW